MEENASSRIDPQAATIAATLTIDLPPEDAQLESQFVLAERFKVTAAAGADATLEVAKVDKPFPGLQAVTIRAKPQKPAPRRIAITYQGRMQRDIVK